MLFWCAYLPQSVLFIDYKNGDNLHAVKGSFSPRYCSVDHNKNFQATKEEIHALQKLALASLFSAVHLSERTLFALGKQTRFLNKPQRNLEITNHVFKLAIGQVIVKYWSISTPLIEIMAFITIDYFLSLSVFRNTRWSGDLFWFVWFFFYEMHIFYEFYFMGSQQTHKTKID